MTAKDRGSKSNTAIGSSMWRSFFYALGYILILTGAQTLVLDHVVTVRAIRLPNIVRNALDGDVTSNSQPLANLGYGGAGAPGLAGRSGLAPNNVPQRSQLGFSNNSFGPSESRFGPSRFAGPQYGHYGGPRVDYAPQYGNASREAIQMQQAGFQQVAAGGPQRINDPQRQVFYTRDWMPWSLLAIGTMVVLYTRSWHRTNQD